MDQVKNVHGSRLRQMKVHVYMDWGLGFVDYGLAFIGSRPRLDGSRVWFKWIRV